MGQRRKFIFTMPWWINNIFFTAGFLMIAYGWWLVRDHDDLMAHGDPITAFVVHDGRTYSSNGTIVYKPEVEVHSPEHGVFLFTPLNPTSQQIYEVGQKLTVMVDPMDRNRVAIKDYGDESLVSFILLLFGSFVTSFSLLGMWVFSKFARKNNGGSNTNDP